MDFLDYEEETEINESDSPHQSVSKLLDDKELLSEVRATPSIAAFLKTNASLVLKAALTKDGEVDDDDDTVDQKQRYTPADRRAYVASEVLRPRRRLRRHPQGLRRRRRVLGVAGGPVARGDDARRALGAHMVKAVRGSAV